MRWVVALCVASLGLVAASTNDILAIDKAAVAAGATPVGVVLLPGMQIASSTYIPLLQQLQEVGKTQKIAFAAGALNFPWNLVQPLGLSGKLDSLIQQVRTEGGLPDSAPIVFAAHSLGTVFLQGYVANISKKTENFTTLGQVLMGGFLLRNHWQKLKPQQCAYPVPTLTIGGEMDGLVRITRIAESMYHQTSMNPDDFPVAILPGQSHMQFASGPAPSTVKKKDLKPEITEDAAHKQTAALFADYVLMRLKQGGGSVVKQALASTKELLAPIVQAYEFEGSRRFNFPKQIGGDQQASCYKGGCVGSFTEVGKTAVEIISSPLADKLKVTNEFVSLSSTPITGEEFHLPNVTHNPDGTVSVSSYTQAFWDDGLNELFEKMDTAFAPTSAKELATKLYSRQCTEIRGMNMPNVSFSVDDPNFCQQTNEQTYAWALKLLPQKTRDRFGKSGTPFTFAPDFSPGPGPFWIHKRLQFKDTTTSSGQKVVEISSPMSKTEIDYWQKHFHIPRPKAIPDPGCFHYCKLLSPARVIEWAYLDGLRDQLSLPQDLEARVEESPLFV